MSTNRKLAAEVITAIQDVLIPVRSGEGFDEAARVRLLDSLREASREWATAESIDRVVVHYLVAVVPDLDSSSYLYPEDDAAHIREAAVEISASISDALGPIGIS